jgi:hypothetical protein
LQPKIFLKRQPQCTLHENTASEVGVIDMWRRSIRPGRWMAVLPMVRNWIVGSSNCIGETVDEGKNRRRSNPSKTRTKFQKGDNTRTFESFGETESLVATPCSYCIWDPRSVKWLSSREPGITSAGWWSSGNRRSSEEFSGWIGSPTRTITRMQGPWRPRSHRWGGS